MDPDHDHPIELLSPAGDFASLRAAIQSGADSVYFGVGRLNMRLSSTKNFQPQDLPEISKICHENHIQAYLTLNTIIYDADLEEMKDLVLRARDTGIDALIASDFSVIEYANRQSIPVHISTQANISNIEALKFYSAFGDVVVLARELDLDEVKKITAQAETLKLTGPSGKPIRIEAFIHGALCMSVSGKCYLSLHEKNKSANRGECMQLCRRGYTVTEKEEGYRLDIDTEYIMSPKDLSTMLIFDRILESGIRLLKIEGRGRAPEYVKVVTSCYRQAIDDWKRGQFSFQRAQQLEEKLKTVYNRGFWQGYYFGSPSGEWNDRYGSSATKKKVYVGKGINYYQKAGVAEFLIEAQPLELGDEILIIGPTTGVLEDKIREIRVDDRPVEKAEKGMQCSFPVPEMVRISDKLYKWIPLENKNPQT